MKKSLLSAAAVAVLGLLLSSFAFSQEDKDQKDKEQMVSAVNSAYVISAKAGGVNYVEGKVSIVRKDGKSGLLLKSDTVEIGDKVTTSADGKAEILLNPGSFVRLGANTEFEFETTDLDNLKLKLKAGSAIFEVYADNEFKVTLDLPDADIELTKSGVYRVDVLKDGSGKLSVWKGRVIFDDQEIKAGKSAVIKGKAASGVAKFDRDDKDALDIWSDLRAREASKINKRLQRDALSTALLGSYNRGGWNMYGTLGLWVFDPFSGRWCFLPFGYGWSSPYGYGYGFNINYCPLPPTVYNPPPNPNPTPTTNPNTLPPERVVSREERSRNNHTPTFQRFENNTRGETRGGGRRIDDGTVNNNNNSSGGVNWNNGGGRSDSSSSSSPSSSSSTPSQSSPSTPSSSPGIPSRTETKDPGKID